MTEPLAGFRTEADAQRAVERLVAAGVPRAAIRVESRDGSPTPLVKVTGAHRAALISGLVGTALGVAAGLVVTVGGLDDPLLAFLAGPTPFLAALKGGVGGAGVGTLFGYILGLGFWGDDGETGPLESTTVSLHVEDPALRDRARAALGSGGATAR